MKKILLLIAALIVFTTIVFVMYWYNNPSGEIKILVDSNKTSNFNEFMFEQFKTNSKITGEVIVSEDNGYFKKITEELSNNGNYDVIYTVFSSQIYELLNNTEDKQLWKGEFKELPDSFKSLSIDREEMYSYIPVTMSPWGLYYNKKMFEELNLTIPQTSSDLVVLADEILKRGKTPFAMVDSVKWPLTAWFDYISLREYGIEFHKDLLNGDVSFTSEEMFDICNKLQDMIDSDYFFREKLSRNWNSIYMQIEKGDAIMFLSSTFFYDNAPMSLQKDLGWFPFPLKKLDSEYDEIVSSSGYITKVGDKKRAIEEFINYAISFSGQRYITQYSSLYPINKKRLEFYNREDLTLGIDQITRAKALSPSFDRNNNSELYIYVKNAINMILTSNNNLDNILMELEKVRIEKVNQ